MSSNKYKSKGEEIAVGGSQMDHSTVETSNDGGGKDPRRILTLVKETLWRQQCFKQ